MNPALIVLCALLSLCCAACGMTTRPVPEMIFTIHGFTTRETRGVEPVFDLSAAQAKMRLREGGFSPGPANAEGSDSAGNPAESMDIQDVRFVVFRNGAKSGLISSDTGSFYPGDKIVELKGHVIYTALDDSFHLQAEKMAWDPKASILTCQDSVCGFFRNFEFTADRLDMTRSRNVFHLHNAKFEGPG